MTTEELISEIESENYSVSYFRPCSHVIAMRFEEDAYSDVRYIINDDGGEDTDFGCFVLESNAFSDIRFDWYDGQWKSDDAEMKQLLNDCRVLDALNAKFASVAVCIGLDRANDDVPTWKRIISRCLSGDDSLIDTLDVMSATDNASSSHPARYGTDEDDDWAVVPFYERRGA